ncbi:hypothetical protein GGS23DRAFT_594141 [Durotheca rogersii]|uniref:uncharacterized protein n=1 Tax=Durotheca rogersii TaxID=419775 RepID=UPI00221FC235|nr:uncharacterized protein GGS23DRAFT_594141 [Durotheca rogersii]KAI5865987.1 hypothetical protein GGS23DRAFT_594141 [Durotheca rogersii]
MSSPSSNSQTLNTSGSPSSRDGEQPSYMTQRYLSEGPTIPAVISGANGTGSQGTEDRARYHTARAAKALKKFDDAWKNASDEQTEPQR